MIDELLFRPNMDSQEENVLETMKTVNEIVLAVNLLLAQHPKVNNDFRQIRANEIWRKQNRETSDPFDPDFKVAY